MSDMKSALRGFRSPIPWMVALNVIGVNLIAPVLPSYAGHFGVGFAAASTLVTVFALARMSFRLTAGTLADRLGSRLICAIGGTVQAAGALIASFAPELGVLLVARGMQGIGSALFGTSVNRYLLVETDKAELGSAVGVPGWDSDRQHDRPPHRRIRGRAVRHLRTLLRAGGGGRNSGWGQYPIHP